VDERINIHCSAGTQWRGHQRYFLRYGAI